MYLWELLIDAKFPCLIGRIGTVFDFSFNIPRYVGFHAS